MTTRKENLIVMKDFEVGNKATLGETRSKSLTTSRNILGISGNIFTVDSVVDVGIGAIITGLVSGSTADVTGIDHVNKQFTVANQSGAFSSTENISIVTPFVSEDNDAFITVGGLKALPSIFGQTGSDFATGLAGKVDWRFFEFDGFVQYGAGVTVPTVKTIIRRFNSGTGDYDYYLLNSNAGTPYIITGVIATDEPFFVPVQGSTMVTSQETARITAVNGQTSFTFAGEVFDDINNNHMVIVDDLIIAETEYSTVPPDRIVFNNGLTAGQRVRVRTMAPLQSVIRGSKGERGAAGIGQRFNWIKTNTNNHAVVLNEAYFVDTTASALTLVLPSAPVADDTFAVADYNGTWASNPVTLNRNGKPIMGLNEDMVLTTNWARYVFTYVDNTIGWRLAV